MAIANSSPDLQEKIYRGSRMGCCPTLYRLNSGCWLGLLCSKGPSCRISSGHLFRRQSCPQLLRRCGRSARRQNWNLESGQRPRCRCASFPITLIATWCDRMSTGRSFAPRAVNVPPANIGVEANSRVATVGKTLSLTGSQAAWTRCRSWIVFKFPWIESSPGFSA